MNDDTQLIDETLAGQSAAFGQLVTKYQDRLYNTLVHVTGSLEEAADVAQDAFVQAFLKLKTFQKQSAFLKPVHYTSVTFSISPKKLWQMMSHFLVFCPTLLRNQSNTKEMRSDIFIFQFLNPLIKLTTKW